MISQRILVRALIAFGLFTLLAACSGGAEIGEACSKEAAADECEDAASCAKTKASDLVCLKTCSAQSDCPAETECTGAKASAKVCQPN